MKSLVGLLLASIAFCQSPLPSGWAGGGVSYGVHGGGWVSTAFLVNSKTETYSFTTFEETLSKTKPYLIISSVRSGACTVMKSLGNFSLLGCLDVGSATSGTNAGLAYSGTGVGVYKIGKTNWTILVPVRYVKTAAPAATSTILELGIGRSW